MSGRGFRRNKRLRDDPDYMTMFLSIRWRTSRVSQLLESMGTVGENEVSSSTILHDALYSNYKLLIILPC